MGDELLDQRAQLGARVEDVELDLHVEGVDEAQTVVEILADRTFGLTQNGQPALLAAAALVAVAAIAVAVALGHRADLISA